jgi:hypothetical protein
MAKPAAPIYPTPHAAKEKSAHLKKKGKECSNDPALKGKLP